ncbi:MAG: molecular chaperone HtpG [Oscillospiraceae bacterium]|nr:molecular chaperone HtpG [Oscillospiraceae bacterium]
MIEKGGISVETKHIFPIIKRWLYSEKEIFLRELVSNACDAVTKLKRLLSLGEVRAEDLTDAEFKITVELDDTEKTIKITDNGIGMNAEELKKYITQIALSGALDFIEKYETTENSADLQDDTAKNGIIGHFGLGFYSSFMVADKVDIRSRSYTGGSGVFWTCSEEGEFEMSEETDAKNIGTEVILHINEENSEFLSEYKIKDTLEKYCAFMPVPIYFKKSGHECEHKDKNKDGETECACKTPINETAPLWTKNPSSCEKEEYHEFYRKAFRDYKEPLFYIHINADYPLNFKGILYFPKLNTQFDSLEGQVKLYYNQVFVADNIKEVIPEYLLMLKGVVDCPELPLNVSRSYLQNSGYVSKISAHIVKKVSDKLSSLFNTERENYEKFWGDINTFVLYGCLRDHKFYERVNDIILYKNTDGSFKTLSEITGGADKTDKAEETEEAKKTTVYYTNDPAGQAVYVNMRQRAGYEVFILENMIETQFINLVETKSGETGIKFARVDSEISVQDETEDKAGDSKYLTDLFKEAAGSPANLKIEVGTLGDDKIPAVFTLSEDKHRMADMLKQYRTFDVNMAGLPETETEETFIINSKNPLIKKLAQNKNNDNNKEAAEYIYMLSLLTKRGLSAGELEKFIERGVDLCGKVLN